MSSLPIGELFVISIIMGGLLYLLYAFLAGMFAPSREINNIGNTARNSHGANNIHRPISEGVFEWPELGHFDVDIVGEASYQSSIAAIAGEHSDEGPDKIYTAYLVPENDNQYDNKAVRVDIEEMTVGYFDRETARRFRRRLGAKKLTEQITTCKAILKGGHIMRDGSKAFYGVMLDIKEFD